MPFDGSGNYTPAAAPNFPALAGTTIQSAYYNNVVNDLATAFNNCLTRDGQGKPSAAINWNAQNLTNVATFSAGASTLASATITAPLGRASGGTGTGTAPTNGQLLIGNGTGYALANITGDSNISVTNGAGTIALSFVGGGGSVSSINAASTVNGLSFSGGPITTSGTLTLGGTLSVASGGTGATDAATGLANLGGLAGGAITSVALTMNTGVILGRTTASTGAIEEITPAATLTLTGGSLAVASVPNALTFNNGGAGSASGTTFNGAAARTISYNSIGALPENPRTSTAGSNSVTPTFSIDIITRDNASGAITVNNPSGTDVDGFGFVVRLRDSGVSRSISYGTEYRAIGVTLPTATVANKWTILGVIFNDIDNKADVVSVAQEA